MALAPSSLRGGRLPTFTEHRADATANSSHSHRSPANASFRSRPLPREVYTYQFPSTSFTTRHRLSPRIVTSSRRFKCAPCRAAGEQADSDPTVTSELDPTVEHSPMANEELLLFFYQLDLNTRLQKALNLDQYEPAKQLREKIAELDREMARQREAKMGTSSREEAQDKGLAVLRLKADLQRAVEAEAYEEAAQIRKKMSKMESDTLAASAAALAMRHVAYAFRLGQKVKHKEFGYRGVVAGMDPMCCESKAWMEAADVSRLKRGPRQPFYQVLLDLSNGGKFPVAYVAEDLLIAPEEPDKETFIHPYLYLLFFGADSSGDFIPSKPLREKYNAPRHEVPPEDDTGSKSGSDDES